MSDKITFCKEVSYQEVEAAQAMTGICEWETGENYVYEYVPPTPNPNTVENLTESTGLWKVRKFEECIPNATIPNWQLGYFCGQDEKQGVVPKPDLIAGFWDDAMLVSKDQIPDYDLNIVYSVELDAKIVAHNLTVKYEKPYISVSTGTGGYKVELKAE